MQEVQSGQSIKAAPGQIAGPASFVVQKDKKQSFLAIMRRFQDLPADVPLDKAVLDNYELCDKVRILCSEFLGIHKYVLLILLQNQYAGLYEGESRIHIQYQHNRELLQCVVMTFAQCAGFHRDAEVRGRRLFR